MGNKGIHFAAESKEPEGMNDVPPFSIDLMRNGSGEHGGVSFFLPPYCKIIELLWSLENIAFMIRNTDDAPGDICHHARSEIIQAVSKVTLDDFMHGFNELVTETILESGDTFYEERGSRIHSVEVRSFECLYKKIDRVLQEIIKESTDRINRLQLVASENEVAIEKMKGRIEEEKLKGQLIDVKNEHQRKEALIDGEA